MTINVALFMLLVIGYSLLVYAGYRSIKWVVRSIKENDVIGMQLYMSFLIIIVIILYDSF